MLLLLQECAEGVHQHSSFCAAVLLVLVILIPNRQFKPDPSLQFQNSKTCPTTRRLGLSDVALDRRGPAASGQATVTWMLLLAECTLM